VYNINLFYDEHSQMFLDCETLKTKILRFIESSVSLQYLYLHYDHCGTLAIIDIASLKGNKAHRFIEYGLFLLRYLIEVYLLCSVFFIVLLHRTALYYCFSSVYCTVHVLVLYMLL
jgi:hypothetical protein